MRWIAAVLDDLSRWGVCPYQAGGPAASEPTALAALALCGHDRAGAAITALDWLVRVQADDGSLGVTASQSEPRWPTSLAVLAWTTFGKHSGDARYASCAGRAVDWLLSAEGTTPARQPHVGHDTTILGWPWVVGTHSWLEPTAFSVMALRAAGMSEHKRTREAIRLLFDRQLPDGGYNYGNTLVLGQATLPHVQPTGLAMLGLAGEGGATKRLKATLVYLEHSITLQTTTTSACFGLMGLAAQAQPHPHQSAILAAAHARTQKRGAAPYPLALLALAESGSGDPWDRPPACQFLLDRLEAYPTIEI
jgi:hypothetical protein